MSDYLKEPDDGTFCIVLCKRLEKDLTNVLERYVEKPSRLVDMIDIASEHNMFSKAIANDFHKLRQLRNKAIHEESEFVKAPPEWRARWCEEVFDLEEVPSAEH